MASTYDKASLVMIPSGTKASKIFSQKPVNGDGDFTFSRSTAATRVNASGNIEKETQNLLLQSNTFSNAAWSKFSNTTYTATTETITDPFGVSNSVYKVTLTGSGYFFLRQTLNGETRYITASTYIKKSSSDLNVTIDQSDGDVTNSASNTDWQRLSSSHASGHAFSFIDIVLTGVSGDYYYVSSAQMELGGAARDYIETTAAAVEGGITDNVPRLDYTDSSCPALLLEPQRTNVVPNSELFDQSYSTYYNFNLSPVVTINYGTSPEGLSNSSRLDTTAANSGWYTDGQSASSGETYTCSIFAKLVSGSESDIVRFGFSLNGDKLSRYDLSDGTINYSHPDVTTSIEDYGNDWYRLIQTITTTSSGTLREVLYSYNNAGDYEIYGHQVEAGSYATSYIPTYGSSVTRVVETCLLNNSSALPTSYPFTLYTESIIKSIGSEFLMSFLNASDNVSYASMYVSSGIPTLNARSGSSDVSVASPNSVSEGSVKIVGVFESSTLKLFVNGALKASISNTTTFQSGWNDLLIGQLRTITDTGDRTTNRQALVFPTALTDQEAIDLTTI